MAASSVLTVNYKGEALFVNVFVPNKESWLRQNEKFIFMCETNCEYLISFFQKKKNLKKSLCFLKIRVLSLYVLTCCFIWLRGMEVQEELHI